MVVIQKGAETGYLLGGVKWKEVVLAVQFSSNSGHRPSGHGWPESPQDTADDK